MNDSRMILIEPELKEYWYEKQLLEDSNTMDYNAGYDVTYAGYHYDTGCIDFPEDKWQASYQKRKTTNRFFAYLKDTVKDCYVGYVNYQYNPTEKRYECGILIEAKYRGLGYSKDGLYLLCDTAFKNGIIVHSDILLDYLKNKYPEFCFVSSTTKVLTDYNDLLNEVNRDDFSYVVPDFRLNRCFDKLGTMTQEQKDKIEFLCNECCWIGCYDRKACYETVSRMNLGENCNGHICVSPEAGDGYRFSKAMHNPAFISVDDIRNIYMPMGFTNFKIEGRSLGSALVLEFLLYYMTKPEYQINVREEIYLDNMLDIF